MAPGQVGNITARIEGYHKNEPTKQALVSPVVKNVTLKKPEVEVALDTMGLVSNDEITQSIRDNIIIKQQAYLQGEIAKTMSVEDGIAFNKKNSRRNTSLLGNRRRESCHKRGDENQRSSISNE